jgi:hypothetical protein
MNTKTLSIAIASALTLALAIPATAMACDGEHGGKDKGARFQKADKNNDGFLTQTEVGAKRWERLKKADKNNDQKVSKAELKEMFKSRKMDKRRGHDKQKKS